MHITLILKLAGAWIAASIAIAWIWSLLSSYRACPYDDDL
jgi:uncharacterized protein (DUF697 family)